MTELAKDMRGVSRWRVAGWSLAGLLLAAPLAAMQFTDEVAWDAADFAFAAVLVGGVGLTAELVARRARSGAYRAGACVALAAAFLLIWVNAAVGIVGSEQEDANMLFGLVLAAALAGALVGRFRAPGMARAMAGTAAAQVAVAGLILATGIGTTGPFDRGPLIGLTCFFTAAWLLAAWLFARAAAMEGKG